MKVSVENFKKALLLFEAGLLEHEQEEGNKVVLGIGFRRKNQEIFSKVEETLAKDGFIDVDELREDINAGLEANKGTMSFLPKIPNFAREFLGVTLERVVITQEYADYFFDNILPAVATAAV